MNMPTISTRTSRLRTRAPLALALSALLPMSVWAQQAGHEHAGHAPARTTPPAPTAAHAHGPGHAAPHAHEHDDARPKPDAHAAHADSVPNTRHQAHDAHGEHGQHGQHGQARGADGHTDHAGHARHADHQGQALGGRDSGQPGQDPHDGHGGHAHPTTHAEPSGHHDHDGHAGHAEHGRQTEHAGHAPSSAHQGHAGRGAHGRHGAASDQPLTPIPALTEADHAAAFPELAHHAMEHASPITTMVLFDRLEAWDADHGTGQAWEATAWIGGDIHRLWLRSEGERSGGRTESSDLEVLYGRSVTAWWDLVGGVRQDFRPRGRTWGAFGVQGLAPHMFEVSATAYVGSGGQVQLKAEAEYDIRFTNRLILQPLVEATVSLEDEPQEGIGSGLGKLEAGLRLRYEFSRRFAPYVGLVHERNFGRTADYAETAGGHTRDTRVVAGVRVWF